MHLVFDGDKTSFSAVQVKILIRHMLANTDTTLDILGYNIKEYITQLQPSQTAYNYMIMNNGKGELIARFPKGNHATAALINPLKKQIVKAATLNKTYNLGKDVTFGEVVDYFKSKKNSDKSVFCNEIQAHFDDLSKTVTSPEAATVYAAGECWVRPNKPIELNDFSGGYHHSLSLDTFNYHRALFKKLGLDCFDFKYTSMVQLFNNLGIPYQSERIEPILLISKFMQHCMKKNARAEKTIQIQSNIASGKSPDLQNLFWKRYQSQQGADISTRYKTASNQ